MELLAQLEDKYKLPSGLLSAVMKQESGGNVNAVSPKGARGAFQFMPATAKQYGVDVNSLESSADGAARMYADLLKTHNGDVDKALASYNWGQGNVAKKGMAQAPKETRDYIMKIKSNMPKNAMPQNAWENDPIDEGGNAWENDPIEEPQAAQAESNDGFFNNLSIKNVPENAKNLGAGLVRGAGSLGSSILAANDLLPIPMAMNAIRGEELNPMNRDAERRQGMDSGFKQMGVNTESGGYKGGKLGTEILGTLGVGSGLGVAAKGLGASERVVNALSSGGMNIGGDAAKVLSTQGAKNLATRAVGGGITGATSGALIDPDSAAVSGGISAAIPVAGKISGAIGKSIGIGAKLDDLAKTAIEKYNIPLDRASTSASKMTKATKSLLDDILPFGAGKAQKEATQNAFNREVGKVAGMNAEKLTPDVVKDAKDAIGQAYDKVWGSNKFIVDRQFADDATSLIQDASNKLNPEQSAMLEKHFNNLVNMSQKGEIDGKFVNNWQSELRQIVDSETGLHKKFTNDLRQTVLKAFKRNIPAEDAALLDFYKHKIQSILKRLKACLIRARLA
jgi:hypothetical protein